MSLDRKINRIQFLSGNSLKVIAVLTMLIDHLCKIVLQWLLSNYWGAMADNGQMSWERFREIDYFIRFDLQSIGTIAFPLFCFLLAEGFQHTRSKKRYIGLMLAFALISEVPFDIGFFSAYSRMEDTFPFYLKYQNVFFTLFLGLLTLVCLERFSCKSDLPVDRIKSAVLQVLSVVLFSGIAEGIHCDYGMQGILFISAFYICRNHRIYQVLLFLLAYMGTTGNQPPLCTLLACLLILLYNGKRGKLKLKYFFYVFYPAHILVLYLLVNLGMTNWNFTYLDNGNVNFPDNKKYSRSKPTIIRIPPTTLMPIRLTLLFFIILFAKTNSSAPTTIIKTDINGYMSFLLSNSDLLN